MAVSNVTPSIQYTGNNSNTDFTFTFVVPALQTGNTITDATASITSGGTTLTVTTADFFYTSALQGKSITVNGAGAGGANLETTINTRTSGTVVELVDAASTTVANATITVTTGLFGTAMKNTGDLQVFVDGVEQTYTTHYTVLLDVGDGSNKGGTVQFVTPPTSGAVVTIIRDVELSRTVDFQRGGALTSKDLNAEFDNIVMALQDNIEIGNKNALKFPSSELVSTADSTLPAKTSRQNKVLSFDSNGDIQVSNSFTVTTITGNLIGNVTGDVTGTVSSIANHTTTNLAEGTNLYYTDARFDTRLGTKTTDNLTEGANLYYTNARADARIGAASVGDLSDVDITGATASSGDGNVLAWNQTNQRFEPTPTTIAITAQAPLSYNSSSGALTLNTDGINDTHIDFGTGTNQVSTADIPEQTNLYYTDERVDDRVSALITDGEGITTTYDDSAGTLTIDAELATTTNKGIASFTNTIFDVTGGVVSLLADSITDDMINFGTNAGQVNTDDMHEGVTNLYHTTARARGSISINNASGDGSIAYNNSTGVITYTGPSASETRAHFTGGTGISITSGDIAIDFSEFNTGNITEGSNLYYTDARAQAVSINNVVEDTTPQLGGDLDTQSFALQGTDSLPSTGSYGGQFSGGQSIRLHNSTSDHAIRTQQTNGRQNIAFTMDLDGSYSASSTSSSGSGSGLIYSPLNMQIRDRGESDRTRTTFDVGVPYVGNTGATITQGSVTGKLLDVVAGDRKIYLMQVSGGSFATSTATTGVVTGTVTAVNSIGTNAVELTYDTDFATTAAQSDLASTGLARFSARDVLNTRGMRTSEPELHFEGGRIAFESNGTKQIDITDAGNIELTTRSNGDINVATNGTGDLILKPNLPTGNGGAGGYAGWNIDPSWSPGSTTHGGSVHVKSVLSIDARSDTPTTDLLFNEGIQIKSESNGSGVYSWPTLAFDARSSAGDQTSGTVDYGNTANQGYGNVWFMRYNSDFGGTPSAIESNQILGGFYGGGSTGASTTNAVGAAMFMRAHEDWTTSSTPTSMEFQNCPSGSADKIVTFETRGDKVMVNPNYYNVDFCVYSENYNKTFEVDAVTDKTLIGGVLNVHSVAGNISSNLANGDIYYDSTANRIKVRENGELRQITSVGTHSIWVTANAMYPTTTNGCDFHNQLEVAANKPEIKTLSFDSGTEENAQFSIAMPKRYDGGTIQFIPYWTATSGSGDCKWNLQAVALDNDDAMNTSFGGNVGVTDTLTATNDICRGSTSGAITIAGSPSTDDIVYFNISRDATDGGDTLTADAHLIGIKILYTTNAENDD